MENNKRKKTSVVEKIKNLKPVHKAVILTLVALTFIAVASGCVSLANYNEAREKGIRAFVEDPGDMENVENIINPKRSPIEIYMENPEAQESKSNNATNEGEQAEK